MAGTLGDNRLLRIDGAAQNVMVGEVLGTGDINGDGVTDLIVTSSAADDPTEDLYLIFGRRHC